MHELALSRQLVAIVSRAVPGRQVLEVCVEVGGLRQVVPAALHACWAAVTRETLLANSALIITEIPVTISCQACGEITELGDQLCWQCVTCGSACTRVCTGQEFQLTTVELATTEPVTADRVLTR